MAILKNQEIHFVRLNPNRPEKNMFDPTKFSWSIQCRSTDKAQIAEWKALGLKPKVVREDKDDEESKVLYQQVSFRKNSKRTDPKTKQQTDNTPVEVVNGKGEPIEPGTIGSGSIANVRLYKREYKVQGVEKIGYVLMAVQIVKHKVYIGTPMEDFDECDTETILPDAPKDSDDADDMY